MDAADAENGQDLSAGMGRAFGGALIFSLPLMMTMEMWTLGVAIDRWRLLALILVSMPLLLFLSRYSGFEKTASLAEDLRDLAIAYGVGIVTSAAVLALLALVGPGMSASEIMGRIGLQVVPAALGALLGRSQLGRKSASDESETYGGEMAVMAAGALFLGLNLAPTEEMLLISFRMSAWQGLVLVGVSMAIMHGFVYAAEFRGGSELTPDTPWWSAFLRFTLVGYAVALAVSLFVLWIFGSLDGLGFERALRVVVVLGFPAAIGAAAARLIL